MAPFGDASNNKQVVDSVMKDQDKLWLEISAALDWGSKDKTPIHRFNRLTKEHFPDITTWLNQESCIARNEHLTKDDIHNLTAWHNRTNAKQDGGKIVLFKHNGTTAIVDGNNRVAKYKRDNDDYEMPAIVVELIQAS